MNDALVAILSALVSGWVGYRFGLANSKRERRIEAANRLYEVFQPLHDRLEKEDCDAIKVLQPTIHDQEKAIANLKRYLSKRQAVRLQEAWNEYYLYTNGPTIPFLEQYADTGSIDKRRRIRPLLIRRLDNILNFSKGF